MLTGSAKASTQTPRRLRRPASSPALVARLYRAAVALLLALLFAAGMSAVAAAAQFTPDITNAADGSAVINVYVHPDAADAGKSGDIYVAGIYRSSTYFLQQNGSWILWNGQGAYPTYRSSTIIHDDNVYIAGNFNGVEGASLFVGYGLGGTLKQYGQVYTVPDFNASLQQSGSSVTLTLTPKASIAGQEVGIEVTAISGDQHFHLFPNNTWVADSGAATEYQRSTFTGPMQIVLANAQTPVWLAGAQIAVRLTPRGGSPESLAVYALPYAAASFSAVEGQTTTTVPPIPAGAQIVALDSTSRLGATLSLNASTGNISYLLPVPASGPRSADVSDSFGAKVRTPANTIAALQFNVTVPQIAGLTLTPNTLERSNVALNSSVDMGSFTVGGISSSIALQLSSGDANLQFSKDGGGSWFTAGTVQNGNVVKVQIVNSGASYSNTLSYAPRLGNAQLSVRSTTLARPVQALNTTAHSVSGVTTTTASFAATLDGNGTGYYVIDLASAAAPSVTQVLQGKNGAGATALKSASSVMLANSPLSFSISGLSAATAYKIYFAAKDGSGNAQSAATSDALTTATPVNAAPTLSNIAAQSLAKNTGSGAIPVTVGDAETAAAALLVSATSANTTLIANSALVWGGTGANRTLSVTPTAGQSGSAVITYTVNDGTTPLSKTFTVTVSGAPPTLAAIAAQSPVAGVAYALQLATSVTASDGDAISAYRLAAGSLPTGLSLNTATGAISGTPSATGSFSADLQVQDIDGWSTARTIVFTVTGDAPPSITAPTATSIGTRGVTVVNTISDSDGAQTSNYYIYADSGATHLVSMDTQGVFSGLTANTGYWARTTAQTRNGVTGAWTTQTSPLTFFTTLPPANTAPIAVNVIISGSAQVGQLLSGSYTYVDADGDAEGATTFRWLRNGVALGGATASTYTLVNADTNAAITFEVTPLATVAPTTGAAFTSAATAPVCPPAGYITQGGLTWSPTANPAMDWSHADADCTGTALLGLAGWRLPSASELHALFTSGGMNGQGWVLGVTWSSTFDADNIRHHFVNLIDNSESLYPLPASAGSAFVSCVR